MITVQDTIVSQEVINQEFCCDVTRCKGICCIDGDSGAPLEIKELSLLDEVYEKVKPYMNKKGIASIKKNGKYLIDTDGEYVTPLVEDGEECAYVYFDKGIALCAIEKAFLEGKINFQKPVSCHLYPVRLRHYKDFTAINYHRWKVCQPAVKTGKKKGIPVYKFLKEPLIRKFGPDWYKELEDIIRELRIINPSLFTN